MKKIFTFLGFVGIISISFWSFLFYKNTDFWLYIEKKNTEKENQTILPEKKIIKITSLGHENSYADFLWIDLIQYIGNNLSKDNYTDFSIKMLAKITEISPKFTTAYEWILWMMPIPQNTNLSYSNEQKEKLQFPLQIAEKWIQETCDTEKIWKIFEAKLEWKLWGNNSLKNPCQSGMLPYLIAFYGGQLAGESKIAENYYKVAGLSEDAPSASQILAVLSSADKNNPKTIAKNFFLMATSGFDNSENFACVNFSVEMFQNLHEKNFTNIDIIALENFFKNFKKPDNKDILGTHSCYDMAERGLKYTFLDFINTESQKYPETENIDELLTKINLPHPPITPSQENLTLHKNKNSGLWEYWPK